MWLRVSCRLEMAFDNPSPMMLLLRPRSVVQWREQVDVFNLLVAESICFGHAQGDQACIQCYTFKMRDLMLRYLLADSTPDAAIVCCGQGVTMSTFLKRHEILAVVVLPSTVLWGC